MEIKELNFPIIYKKDGLSEYGGNQEWFPRIWQRKAGCGSTSGANLAAYYAVNDSRMKKVYKGNTEKFYQDEYLELMKEMYTYMTPGPMGFPYVEKFVEKFMKFCKKHDIIMEADIIKEYNTSEDAFRFVKENIDKEHPVALIILHHRAAELWEDNWHWVTVTGYTEPQGEPTKAQVILSNCGERQIIAANTLFEVHKNNTIHMVSFRIKEED